MCSPQQSKEQLASLDDSFLQIARILLVLGRGNLLGSDSVNVRGTSRALRDAHDIAAQRISISSWCRNGSWTPPSREEVVATLQRAITRGCKPTQAYIDIPQANLDVMEEIILAFLSSLSNGGAPIEFVKVGNDVPLSETIVHAIDALGSQLTRLHIRWSSPEDPKQPVQATSSVSGGFKLLLQLVGPRLRDLELAIFDEPLLTCSLNSLTCCTAMTKLNLHHDMYEVDQNVALTEETSMLRTLSTLTSLRDLSLSGGARPPINAVARAERAAHLEACLSPLTALTRLDIRLHCLQHEHHPSEAGRESPEPQIQAALVSLELNGFGELAQPTRAAIRAEWRALAAAAKRMPQLAVLRTHVQADVSDLAALTALTYLRVGALFLSPPEQADAATVTPTVYCLPPRLKRLVVFAPVPVQLAQMLRHKPPATESSSTSMGKASELAVTAAVRTSPSDFISWEAPGVMFYGQQPYWSLGFSKDDTDSAGRLKPLAAAAARNAAVSLQNVFRFKQPHGCKLHWEIGPHLSLGPKSGRLMPLEEPDGTHCGSWLGAVVSELRPLSVRLRGLFLSAREMMAMSRCLDGVKVLDLRDACYSVSSLTLLADLVTLNDLRLRAEDWTWPDDADQDYMTDVMQATFLGLAAPPRRLLACQSGWTAAAGAALATDGDLYSCPAVLPLPQLEELRVACGSEEEEAWLRAGLASAEVQFNKRGVFLRVGTNLED